MVKKEEPKIYYLPNPMNLFQQFKTKNNNNSSDIKSDNNTNKKNGDKDCNKDKPINEEEKCEFVRTHFTSHGIEISIECDKLIQLLLSKINDTPSLIFNLTILNKKLKIIIKNSKENKYIKLKGGDDSKNRDSKNTEISNIEGEHISKHEEYIPNIQQDDLVKTQIMTVKIIEELQTEKYLNSLQNDNNLLEGGAAGGIPKSILKTCDNINNIQIIDYINENMTNKELYTNYKNLALILHPDKYFMEDMKMCSETKFIELTEIYKRITNHDKEIKDLTNKIDELNKRNNLSFDDFLREINIIEMFYLNSQDCTFLLNGTPMSNLIKESVKSTSTEYLSKLTTCDMKRVSEATERAEQFKDEQTKKGEVERLKALLAAISGKVAALNQIETKKLAKNNDRD
jgi:hypothetical protein